MSPWLWNLGLETWPENLSSNENSASFDDPANTFVWPTIRWILVFSISHSFPPPLTMKNGLEFHCRAFPSTTRLFQYWLFTTSRDVHFNYHFSLNQKSMLNVWMGFNSTHEIGFSSLVCLLSRRCCWKVDDDVRTIAVKRKKIYESFFTV